MRNTLLCLAVLSGLILYACSSDSTEETASAAGADEERASQLLEAIFKDLPQDHIPNAGDTEVDRNLATIWCRDNLVSEEKSFTASFRIKDITLNRESIYVWLDVRDGTPLTPDGGVLMEYRDITLAVEIGGSERRLLELPTSMYREMAERMESRAYLTVSFGLHDVQFLRSRNGGAHVLVEAVNWSLVEY